jgi:23S rRNA (uracil1939-C5)-methyltransferase
MPFEFSPQKLVYGGEALGHYQGQPVLVPRALPGERLEVEAVRTAKGVLRARPLRVLEPAPERIQPPCPYFGRCGGCQYQHLAAPSQIAWKKEILRETLRRLGKIVWEGEIVVHAAEPWHYRNQAQLKVGRGPDGRLALGFFEAESHRLFPVDVCLILSARLGSILAELSHPEWLDRLATCREIELLADDRDERVMITLRGDFDGVAAQALAEDLLRRLPGVATVAVERGRAWASFGQPALTYRVGEFEYRISPGSFFQASRFLLPELVRAVVAPGDGDHWSPSPASSSSPQNPAAGAASPPDESLPHRPALALDLFAGVGLFTLPLARRFAQVIGVEANPKSAADLAANAGAQGLGNIRTVAETAFDFLRRFARVGPDLVVLDPPRAGVGANALQFLAGLRPHRIHYISCSPPTLARDLAYLIARGYRLASLDLFDLFPQTYHIECLARLDSSDLPPMHAAGLCHL